jgi:hypothetical protein
MGRNKIKIFRTLAVIIIAISLIVGFASREKGSSGKAGETQHLHKVVGAYVMKINNFIMPMNNQGVLADVAVPPDRSGGLFEGHGVLFSGGFFASGYKGDLLWSNAVASASRIQDYQAGPVGTVATDPKNKMYIVRSDEEAFGTSWQEWSDAVSLGADFYDGDKDGKYDPKDLNGNGSWDPDEDRPDLLADETVWTVYNDGIDRGLRRYSDVDPVGIEIHQTVFGFASSGLLGNMLFVRYKLFNKGTTRLDSVYFGVWADPDLGDYHDDLVGCDAPEAAGGYTRLETDPKTKVNGRNAGYVYNDGADPEYGANPPAFLIDFFQGPIVPGAATDTAFNVKGQYLGVDTLVGKKHLGISSFVHYMQSHATHGDPGNRIEARNYMLGFNRIGQPLNPCTWTFGNISGGVNCNAVDPRYSYSGDPVRNIGWINNTPTDQRQMQNTGPFVMEPKGAPIIITAALIVGRGTSALASIDEAKKISDFAQFIYDQNFKTAPSPPIVKPTVRTTENSIDLIWNTAEAVNFKTKTIAYDQRFQGFELWAFRTNNTADKVAGVENAKIIERWDIADNIDNVLVQNSQTGEIETIHYKGLQLDPKVFSDKNRGVIKYSLTVDPFTGGPIVKGKPYFLAITGYALNHDALLPSNPAKPVGNYYISGAAFVGITANVKKILEGGIVPGRNLNDPYDFAVNVPKTGATEATATFEEIDKTKLTGDTYDISFFRNTDSTNYFMNYRVVKKTKNDTMIKSSSFYDNLLSDADKYTIPIIDGVIPRIKWVDAEVKTAVRSSSLTWAKTFTPEVSGVFYMGTDIKALAIKPLGSLGNRKSTLTTADQLGQVEIVFKPGKAYRYISNALATAYLSGGSNTTIAGGAYYVDVPFQAWMKDTKLGINKQLAVGFTERLSGTGAKPDGKWDPDTSIDGSKEFIIVFNSPYEAAPDTVKNPYIGFVPATGARTWANLNGWTPSAAAGFKSADSIKARSPWFDALYVVGFEKKTSADTWSASDVLTVPISYPITKNDKFTFTTTKAGQRLTQADKKSLFDKVNVFPNPLYAYNPAVGYYADPGNPKNDEPYVTFSNLPEKVTIKVYTISGQLLRTLTESDKGAGASSPFLNWDIKNEEGLRAASGMYLAVVSSPGLGEKVLKFAIIQPQKQIRRF